MTEYLKTINLFDDTTNQPSKFRIRNWVEINDKLKGRYDNSNIRFKMSIIRSHFCDCSDAYILARRTITARNTVAAGAAVNNTNTKVIFKNCAPFTDCITETNNTQVDDAKKIDVVTPMYNIREYSDASLRTSGSLSQYYRDEQALGKSGNIIYFPDDNNNK